MNKGDALQASEKIWGATAHALKALAQQRGWNHRFHNHLRAAANYLGVETGRSDWGVIFNALDHMHTNFYEHQFYVDEVRPLLDSAKHFCQELFEARSRDITGGRQLTAEQEAGQATRLRTLTRPLSEQAAFGDELSPEELEDLPPVSPTQP